MKSDAPEGRIVRQPNRQRNRQRNRHQNRQRFRPWRLATLAAAMLVIAINPFFCYHGLTLVQGWYQSIAIGGWWIVSPLEGLESILTGKEIYLPALIAMLTPLIVAFVLGRVFCSWVCPLTLLLEVSDWLRGKAGRQGERAGKRRLPRALLWLTLVAELLLTMILGAPVFVFLSPPGLVGREIMMLVFFGTLAWEGLLLVVILLLEVFGRRFFCRTFCPLGALLALVGMKRRLRLRLDTDVCTSCGRCGKTCPMGLKPDAGEGASAYCWNCGDCVDICPSEALRLRWRWR